MSRSSSLDQIYSHLTPDERIDKACELLAIGVMRLAEKEGLLLDSKNGGSDSQEKSFSEHLHPENAITCVKEAA